MGTTTVLTGGEGDILARVIEPQSPDLAPEAARALLKLGFGEADRARMHELAVRNQGDGLSAEEKATLENYVRVGHLLALIHSKARRSLATRDAP